MKEEYVSKIIGKYVIIIRRENSLHFIRCQEWDDAEIELVKHGDLIRLEHILTRRNIHSHQQPAPLSKKQFQVFNYFILPFSK